MSYGSDEEIASLWSAAMQRLEEESPPEKPSEKRPVERSGTRTAQEMSMICLNGKAQKSIKRTKDEKYDYEWDKDGNLVFSREIKRGSRIDCWLGSKRKGSITTLYHLSYLTDSTDADEPMISFGSWEWDREMCSGLGGYNIVRNFWGEDEGIPAIRKSISDGDFNISDEERFNNAWAKLALSELGDDEE